jgi:aspartyl/asparaginyl beta-hydroxylase (cupin superfamily)
MNENPIDARDAAAAGFKALERGELAVARASLERAIAQGAADAGICFALSRVHHRSGAAAEEGAALDETLKLDPHHVPALIAKGDLYSAMQEVRAAAAYYRGAIDVAANLQSLPAELRRELRRAEDACERFARSYESHLLKALVGQGLADPGTERFMHAVDLLLGKKQIYFQQPKHFFFPELPQIQFYDRRLFPWTEKLARKTGLIRDELRAILSSANAFVPYIQRAAHRPAFDPRGLLDNPDWGAFHLVKSGAEVAENAARCPHTLAALRDVPLCEIEGRTPTVLFSLLRPGAHILPHHGFMNTRLICHLPLIVPPGCALRVGNETRPWREGEIVIFDDTIEHEAWNPTQELRVVLIFDVWRPELSAKERALVATMLKAIDQFGGPRREWTD